MLTSEVVAQEVVRTLVGSIGLLAAVPLTALLAALTVRVDRVPDQPGWQQEVALVRRTPCP